MAEVAEAIGLRARPSTEARTVVDLAAGTRLEVTGESVAADGYRWWPVRDATGKQGFVAGPHLTCGTGAIHWAQPGGDGRLGDGTGGPDDGAPMNDGTAGPDTGPPPDDGTAGPSGPAPVAADRPDPPNPAADAP
jgi:hypothetical protein